MKQIIISYQNGARWYPRGQRRLDQSLAEHWDGERWMMNESTAKLYNFRSHQSAPYAFKIDAFKAALAEGYEQILYVDCSVVAMAKVYPVFDYITEHGYIMQEAGHNAGRWTNDRALNYFKVTRDKAMTMLMYGNAGFLGLDFTNPTAEEFFHKWSAAADAGMFAGSWTNENFTESHDERCAGHRHDMCCGSIIANKLDMKYVRGDKWLHYQSPDVPAKDGVIFHAQGMM